MLADGSRATITEDSVKINKNGQWRRVTMTEDTDLWFALRGAGTSFAIVTEFRVRYLMRCAC